MSKTFKLSGIFLITVTMLMVFRIVSSFVHLSDNLADWLFGVLFQVLIMGVMPYVLYRAFIKNDGKTFLRDMRVRVKIHPLTYVFAILVGILVFYINLILSTFSYSFLTSIGYTYAAGVGTIYSSPEVLIFEIITSAILPAIFEELTDRGLLLAVFEDNRDDLFKVIVIGLLFGVLHQNITQLGSAAFAGVILTYVAVKCGSIIPSMIIHFLNNFFVTIYSYSGQKNGWFYGMIDAVLDFTFKNFLLLLLCAALAVVLLCLLLTEMRKINFLHRIQEEPIPGVKVENEGAKDGTPVRIFITLPKMSPDPEADFDEVFGTADGKRPVPEIPKPEAEDVFSFGMKAKKINHKEYILFYIGIAAAALTTLFTFLWGVWR